MCILVMWSGMVVLGQKPLTGSSEFVPCAKDQETSKVVFRLEWLLSTIYTELCIDSCKLCKAVIVDTGQSPRGPAVPREMLQCVTKIYKYSTG